MKRISTLIFFALSFGYAMATTLSGTIPNTKLEWSFDTEIATLTIEGDDYLCLGNASENYFFDNFKNDIQYITIGKNVKRLDAAGAIELANRFNLNDEFAATDNVLGEMQVFAYSLPFTAMNYLKAIVVAEENASLASFYDGLYSKDLTTLLFFPLSACRYEEGEDIVVDDFADELTIISTGAFREVFGREEDKKMEEVKLFLPETITSMEKSAIYFLNQQIDDAKLYLTSQLPPVLAEEAIVVSGVVIAVNYMYYPVWMNALKGVNASIVVYEESYANEMVRDPYFECRDFETEDGFRGYLLCDGKGMEMGVFQYIGATITSVPYEMKDVTIPSSVSVVVETWEKVWNEEYEDWDEGYREERINVPVIKVGIYSDEIQSIHIPSTVTKIEGLNSAYLQSIHVDEANVNYASVDGVLFNKEKTTLLKYPAGRTESSYTVPNHVTTISRNGIYNNPYVKEISLPSVKSLDGYAIENCTSLEIIHVGSNLTDVAYGNFQAPNLLNIYVDSKNPVFQSIDGVLVQDGKILLAYPRGRTAAKYIVPEGLTEIAENAIERNDYLTELVLPSTLKRIQIEAIYLPNLTKINLPESLEIIDGAAIASPLLKQIHIPSNVKIIGVGPFMDCALENITVDAKNPYYTAVDGVLYTKSMNCLVQYPNAKKDTTFTVPANVSSLSLWSFVEVPALKELVFQDNLVLVEECLNDLENLEAIVCKTLTPPYLDEDNYYMLREFCEDVVLYIPYEAHDAYINHPVWGRFQHIKYISADKAEVEKDKVEVVEDETSVEISWPKVDEADNYTIVIYYKGMPICTLTFNAQGQLLNINFERNAAPRAAAEGFKFTVTGLDSGTNYTYSIVATAQGEEVKTYEGSFTTLGETTHITEATQNAIVTVVDGMIMCDTHTITIYTLTGRDVTAQNGCLTSGVYVVTAGSTIMKVMVR